MNSRLVKLVIGTRGEGSHNGTEVVLVRVVGSHTTNDEMRRASERAEEAIGFTLDELLDQHETDTISLGQLEILELNGFDTTWPPSDSGMFTPALNVETGVAGIEAPLYSAVALVMFYASYGSDDFVWEIIEPPKLVGSHNSILGSGSGRCS